MPNQAAGLLAHDSAYQFRGHVQRPAQIRDFWRVESLAETFAGLDVGAAFGLDRFRVRTEANRSEWEPMPAGLTAPLVRADDNRGTPAPVVYHYGPYPSPEDR